MYRFARAFITAITLFAGSTAMAETTPSNLKTAMFAGGCFWCMQPSFDNTKGVTSTSVGYAGGSKETANYDAVSTGKTGHEEVIQVTYDPAQVTYETLLTTFLENIDPTQADGQFGDRGSQYMTAIYYIDDAQKNAAQKALDGIAAKFTPTPIAVKIKPSVPFYPAEDYHQKYYEKNKLHYNAYKYGSGRGGYIEKTWKKQ